MVPVKNVDGLEVPPLATGLATAMLAVPTLAMSAALMVAVSFVLELNVVVRGLPLNKTWAAGSNWVPFTVRVNAGPPATVALGTSEAMVGVCAVGGGGGGGVMLGGGTAAGVTTGSRKFPASRTT